MARVPVKKRTPAPILDDKMSRPTGNQLYIWCDYIELRCLVDKDRKLSRGRVLEILDDTAQMYGELTDADVVNAEIDQDLATLDDDEVDEPVGGLGRGAQIGTQNEARVAAWFANLSFRVKVFGDAYPFRLSEDGQELQALEVDSRLKELYVQMLISASLRLVPRNRRDELTESFEETSHLIFKELMPKGWEVHRFGAKGASRYEGLLYDKLISLCADIRAHLRLKPHDFQPNDRGDGGLDLVAWHPMGGDERDGLPIALAQCGCTADADAWSKKSLEASPARLGGHINVLHPWTSYYFMPHDLTNAVGSQIEWQDRMKLTAAIVIDRSRLIRLAQLYGAVERCVTAKDTIAEAVALGY